MVPFYIPVRLIFDNIQPLYNGHVSESDAPKIIGFSAAEFHSAIPYLVYFFDGWAESPSYHWPYWPHRAVFRYSASHLRHAHLQESTNFSTPRYGEQYTEKIADCSHPSDDLDLLIDS
jgi:hypothetical protein